MNYSGDFLQLPPVDKNGSRKSLAMPHEDPADEVVAGAECAAKLQQKRDKMVEGRQGFQL